jgi:outer membrane protein insertion porin family
MALGLFESVDIERIDDDSPTTDLRTRVRVVERDHRHIDFSLGYGTEEQLSGEVEWRDINFLGGARRLSVLGRWSWLDRGVRGDLLEPYLFRPDLSLGLRGEAWSLDERFFSVLSLGGGATISHRAGAHNVVSLTYTHRHEKSRVSDEALADPGLSGDLASMTTDGTTATQEGVLSAVQLDLARDTRDVPWDPRYGHVASLRLERAGGWLPGAFDYYTAAGDGRYYHTVRGLTLALRARYGSIAATSAMPVVPYFKRYFLGGAEDLRGWGRLEVSPLSNTGLPIGGQALFATTSEIRIPIVAKLGAVIFADAGNVWRDPWTLRIDDLKSNAGIGVRYWSPFGLLRFDLGYQLTPIEGLRIGGEPQDRRWRIHFSVGQVF